MYKVEENCLTLDEIKEAREVVMKSELRVRRTPCFPIKSGAVSSLFSESEALEKSDWSEVWLKCENMQNTGSFKIRGVASQFHKAAEYLREKNESSPSLVTMSAGNYGKSYSYAARRLGLSATVLMPDTAPVSRAELLQSQGINVERLASSELVAGVNRHQEQGKVFLHPFDDISLIAGHASLGLEILEDVPHADLVVVCCGGGGLLAGVGAAVQQVKSSCRVVGVEPDTANTMEQSLKAGRAVRDNTARSVAAGLAPPFAGENCFNHVQQFSDGVLTVTEPQLLAATQLAFNNGLVVEPSGAAGLAAFINQKIVRRDSEKTVVIILTGGNVSPEELVSFSKLRRDE